MRTVDLCGDWTLTRGDGGEELPAVVPGCVHTDLLAAGRIEDPFFRDNETSLQWIGETDWVYSRSFDVDAELLEADAVLLQADGLDTLAEIRVNDKLVARTDNMFRTWEFDVRSRLVAGENRISIRFQSTFPSIRARQAIRRLYHTGVGAHRIEGGNQVRKSQCKYGWDWGPKLVTAASGGRSVSPRGPGRASAACGSPRSTVAAAPTSRSRWPSRRRRKPARASK